LRRNGGQGEGDSTRVAAAPGSTAVHACGSATSTARARAWQLACGVRRAEVHFRACYDRKLGATSTDHELLSWPTDPGLAPYKDRDGTAEFARSTWRTARFPRPLRRRARRSIARAAAQPRGLEHHVAGTSRAPRPAISGDGWRESWRRRARLPDVSRLEMHSRKQLSTMRAPEGGKQRADFEEGNSAWRRESRHRVDLSISSRRQTSWSAAWPADPLLPGAHLPAMCWKNSHTVRRGAGMVSTTKVSPCRAATRHYGGHPQPGAARKLKPPAASP